MRTRASRRYRHGRDFAIGLTVRTKLGKRRDRATAASITITRFDPTGYETTIAGEVKGFDAAEVVGRKEARRMDRFTQLAVRRGLQAREQACLDRANVDPTRVGALIGTGMGGVETMEQGRRRHCLPGDRDGWPFRRARDAAGTWPSGNGLDRRRGKGVKLRAGVRLRERRACNRRSLADHPRGDRGHHVLPEAAKRRSRGSASPDSTRWARFRSATTIPRRPAVHSMAERDGFVLAEGAAVLILESATMRWRRGATILAEISGYGTTDDANHIVQPGPGGEGAARAIGLALANAGLESVGDRVHQRPRHLDATQRKTRNRGDQSARSATIAYQIPISSTKSMTGHTAGSRRRDRSGDRHEGDAERAAAADDQPADPRS